eukprot:Gregarina_sp_Poly_1__3867@NODE_2155_length_2587_cov_1213_315476_g1389_i0_p2_GENE_NODE_2155_length_2587_cov_1213_315476_g1389_i0NODE_2155_length_2587_cov_1213_315476_g1389_i0_p2_ORF_typecomplete_len160_score5_53AC_N/PF16214_5/1_8OST3_OST6/PF04756_13/0_26OST3_OST6/PF04756_13/3_7e02_NODE_2155_length_2587_cov_1213_315476_g1389_i018402319
MDKFNRLSHRGCSLFSCKLNVESLVVVWMYLVGTLLLCALIVYHLTLGSPAPKRIGLVLHFGLSWLSMVLGTFAVTSARTDNALVWFALSLVAYSMFSFILIRWFPLPFWDTLSLFVFFYLNAGAVFCAHISDSGSQLLWSYFIPLYIGFCLTWLSVVN